MCAFLCCVVKCFVLLFTHVCLFVLCCLMFVLFANNVCVLVLCC